ncbi:FAS-associated factor 2 [Eumeta japonica]|uniref:FAS-associated factor 2 n=1 Tax=Eumeta variegata TaxID=151549 RepID=A0A4C1ULS5_EUMVA|nr:FAS-associated factor 2 [Eumeta japonica]
MDLDDNAMGLTPEQTDKILQFQDLTGIEDMSICRDVLQRHQWDLEVAIQEQLNIREGRPSVFASEARAPPVVHDHIAQQVFTDEPADGPGGMRGLFSYVVNLVVNTLSDPEVIDYINTHALFWGCSVESGEGWRVAQSVGGRRYPLLCVVCVREHRMTVVARSEGSCSPAQLLQRLRRVVADNEPHLAAARADRVEREVTAQLRAAQDEAYAESLAADQEKERRRAADRAARIQQEHDDAMRKRSEERRCQEVLEARKATAARLPPEPAPGEGTVVLLLRLPSGDRLTRRFQIEQNTQDLYDFVFSNPLSPEEFEITTNFPKRVLIRGAYNLFEAGLKDRDVLFVNDMNA